MLEEAERETKKKGGSCLCLNQIWSKNNLENVSDDLYELFEGNSTLQGRKRIKTYMCIYGEIGQERLFIQIKNVYKEGNYI